MNKEDTITLVCFRGDSCNAKTIKIPIKTVKRIVIALIVFIFIFIFSTFLAVNQYLKNLTMNNDIELIMMEKEEYEARLLVLHKKEKDYERKKGKELERAKAIEEEKKIKEEAEAEAKKVLLNNLRISASSSNGIARVTFEVVKKIDDGKRASGYVVIVGKAGEQYFAQPNKVIIKNGLPTFYKQGERFAIKRRKPFDYSIKYPVQSIKSLTVIIYGDDGKILLNNPVNL